MYWIFFDQFILNAIWCLVVDSRQAHVPNGDHPNWVKDLQYKPMTMQMLYLRTNANWCEWALSSRRSLTNERVSNWTSSNPDSSFFGQCFLARNPETLDPRNIFLRTPLCSVSQWISCDVGSRSETSFPRLFQEQNVSWFNNYVDGFCTLAPKVPRNGCPTALHSIKKLETSSPTSEWTA